MKIAKTILGIVYVLLAIFVIRSILQNQRYRVEKAEWQETTAEREESIEALQQTVANKTALAIEWEEKAAQTAVESAELLKKLNRERLEHKEDLAKVETLPVDELVSETREYLQVAETEVMLNSYGIQFTIAAARKNVGKLWLLDFTLTKEVPRLGELIRAKDKEITEVKTALTSAFAALDTNSLVMIELRKQIKADKDILKACEKRVGKINFRDVALGVGVATLVTIAFAAVLK